LTVEKAGYHREPALSISPVGVSTSLARSGPWHFVGSGGRDAALARGKVSHAAWRLNLEKGDASFMAAAQLALGRRRGGRGIAAAQRTRVLVSKLGDLAT
jgi:hypothetical protein